MDDSWGRFWEQLIPDWVAVVTFAFLAQGLWFGLVSLLGPLEPGGALERVSELLFVPFWSQDPLSTPAGRTGLSVGIPSLGGLLVGLGLAWGVKRALDARSEVVGRR